MFSNFSCSIKYMNRCSNSVFYDFRGNSCFTFLSPLSSYSKDNNNTILLRALEGFGIKAEPSGRNDLVLTDSKRKFSGSAFKVSRDRAFHHGTLLINVDMEGMTKYLNPNKAKLLSKGITSVQSRVANLSDLCSILTHDNLSANIADEFCAFYDVDPQRVFREDLQYETLSRIDELNGYYDALRDWSWRFGQTPHFTHELEKRFDWATMDICLTSNNGMITEATIYSDSLFPIFVDLLRETLVQAPYDVPGVQKAFANMRKRLHELSQPRVVQSAPEVVAQAVGDARSVFYRTALEEASTISVAERDAMLGHLDEFEKWFVTAM